MCAAFAVFQHDADLAQRIANPIGGGEVLVLACGGAQFDDQFHQTVPLSPLSSSMSSPTGWHEQAQAVRPVHGGRGALAAARRRALGSGCAASSSSVLIDELVEHSHQFEQFADRGPGIEVVIHLLEKCIAAALDFLQKAGRCPGPTPPQHVCGLREGRRSCCPVTRVNRSKKR